MAQRRPSRHQGFHSGPGGAPGGEKGQLAISDIAADQKAPGPKAGQVLIVFGGFKIGQFQVGPIEQPLALGSGPGRQPTPGSGIKLARNLGRSPGNRRLGAQEVNWLVALTPST